MSNQENNDSYKHISTEEFDKLDFDTVTLLNLREPDEVLVSGIDSAINLPQRMPLPQTSKSGANGQAIISMTSR